MSATIAFNFCSCSNDDDNDSTTKTSSESYTKAISTLKSVDGVNGVFTVEYTGEYNIDDAVKSNLKTSSKLLSYLKRKIPSWKTQKDFVSPLNDTEKDAIALGGIYVPMDGMNEKGLYIANLNDNLDAVMPENPDAGKNDVQTTVAIRYILDKCATVEDALAFLEKINMYPVFSDQEKKDGKKYHACHFAIADNKGKSIVAEWVDEKLVITETKIVTNHNLAKEKNSPTTGDDRNHGTFTRYDSLFRKAVVARDCPKK